MGLDVYFRRDIANVLRATACASEGTAQMVAPSAELEAYRKGVYHALLSVGLAFGLEPAQPQVKPGQSPLVGLLWEEIPRSE